MRAAFGTIGSRRASPRRGLPARLADPWFAERLFDCTPDVVFFVKNVEGQYVIVNETLVRRSGHRSKDDLLGRTALELFPDPLGRLYAEQDRLVVSTGRAIRDRLELHLRPDRTRGWCLTFKFPLLDPGGRVVGVAGLSRDLHPSREEGAGYRALARALHYLQTHYDEPLRIGRLAHLAEMPTRRFQRLVKRVFDLTPGQLLLKARLDAAADLLLESGRSIVDIAAACGYGDQSAFTRQFKATVGLTPRQFRASREHPGVGSPIGETRRGRARD